MADIHTSFSQNVNVTQSQELSPWMKQFLAYLPLPVMELQQKVNQAMVENPLLEPVEDQPEPEIPEQDVSSDNESDDYDDHLDRIMELSASGLIGEDDHYLETPVSEDENERREYLFNSIPSEKSMQEDLLDQLTLSGSTGFQRELAETVIGGIDESGYLRTHPADIATEKNCPLEEVEKAIRLVQTFDPPGIGARNLGECLALQLDPASPDYDLLKKIVTEYLEEIARNHLPQIARELGITTDKLNELISRIRKLHPTPGDAFSGKHAEYIIPVAEVVADDDGGWKVIFNKASIPQIRINKTYLKMLEDPETPKETRSYIRQKVTEGNGLLWALDERKNIITRVTELIVSQQYDFFSEGPSALKSMTMQQIADKIGCHESTISRAVNGKYLKTPQGLFEYKYFFTAGFRTESGDTLSSRGVKEIIRDLIRDEDPASPLSDNKLMELLVKRGLDVKRRTVQKYREELGIPNSNLRRKF